MKRLIPILLILSLFSKPALADHTDDVRFAAHFGLSYAIDDFMYRFCRRAFQMSEWQAQSFAFMSTLFIGAIYKVGENPTGNEMIKSTWENAVGAGSATLIRWQITF